MNFSVFCDCWYNVNERAHNVAKFVAVSNPAPYTSIDCKHGVYCSVRQCELVSSELQPFNNCESILPIRLLLGLPQ